MRWAGVGACVILAFACRQAGSLVDPGDGGVILPDAGKPPGGARWPPPRDGYANPIPAEVKDDRPADLVMNSAVLTAQAYNNWGGTGLYDPPGAFAVQVSFDRPYASDDGSGQVLRYEALMARYLERYGYDVTYTTNLDIAREGAGTLLRRGAFVSPGHDEYWAVEQRDAIDSARDAGMPIYFFVPNA